MEDSQEVKIGLCLSGGGSRAIAFHLGCLKALHQLGLLKKVKIISTVSGGSIIGALYVYSHSNFEVFEKEVTGHLKKGFQTGILVDWIFKGKIILNILNLVLVLLFWVLYVPFSFFGFKSKKFRRFFQISRPFSRTNSVISVFKKKLFFKKRLTEKTRDDLEIVINACELGTKTAFRFGNKTVSNWIFGKADPASFLIAEAVGASAAYPALMPALNKKIEFSKDGKTKKIIGVTLTDGGIYENLGLTPLFPDRSKDFGYPSPKVDILIACDAGNGPTFSSENFQWMYPRLNYCFDSLMRRVQSSNFKHLNSFKESGKIQEFLLSFLGQVDDKLPKRMSEFISREQVVDYPTNFKAMNESNIKKLISRGEQITKILAEQYLPKNFSDIR